MAFNSAPNRLNDYYRPSRVENNSLCHLKTVQLFALTRTGLLLCTNVRRRNCVRSEHYMSYISLYIFYELNVSLENSM